MTKLIQSFPSSRRPKRNYWGNSFRKHSSYSRYLKKFVSVVGVDARRTNAAAADARLFAALRAYYGGRKAAADCRYGESVARYTEAKRALAPRVVATAGAGAAKPELLAALKAGVDAALAAADKDNRTVYYETVPADLEPPPALETMGPDAPLPAYDAAVPLAVGDAALARQLDAQLNA